MAGLVLAMLVYPALSFPRYYNEYPKLPESREIEFKGEIIIICCSMTRSDSIVHAKNYNNNDIILFPSSYLQLHSQLYSNYNKWFLYVM